MVGTEFPPSSFLLYAKPITYITYFFILGWIFGVHSLRERFLKWSPSLRTFIICLLAFFVFLTGYEVIFNFALWTSLMVVGDLMGNLNPDILINKFPNVNVTVNITFATKIFTSLFFVCLYTLYYLYRFRERSMSRDIQNS